MDLSGEVFAAGLTNSSLYPVTPNSIPGIGCGYGPNKGYQGFLTELSADGSSLLFSACFGGLQDSQGSEGTPYSDITQPFGIALDSSLNAYITGWTNSSSLTTTANALFPNPPAVVGFSNGTSFAGAAFVVKISPASGQLLYSTYLGGSGNNNETIGLNAFFAAAPNEGLTGVPPVGDIGESIAVDVDNNMYVSGATSSNNFPVWSGLQPVSGQFSKNNYTGFVSKIFVRTAPRALRSAPTVPSHFRLTSAPTATVGA